MFNKYPAAIENPRIVVYCIKAPIFPTVRIGEKRAAVEYRKTLCVYA